MGDGLGEDRCLQSSKAVGTDLIAFNPGGALPSHFPASQKSL